MSVIYYHMMPAFEYLQPKTIKEAISLLKKCGKEAKILAGGTATY